MENLRADKWAITILKLQNSLDQQKCIWVLSHMRLEEIL